MWSLSFLIASYVICMINQKQKLHQLSNRNIYVHFIGNSIKVVKKINQSNSLMEIFLATYLHIKISTLLIVLLVPIRAYAY